MNRKRPFRPRRAVTALLAAVLLTACGGSGGGAGGSGPAEVTGPAASSAPAAGSSGSGADALHAFTGTTVDGAAFDGSALVGRPTVLWFWAPWCPTCLMQAPGVRAAIEESGDAVDLVGVAGLDATDAMPEFVRLAKVGSMTHVADEAGTLWTAFGVTQQSFFVFLDADGTETFRGKLAPDDIAQRVADLAGTGS